MFTAGGHISVLQLLEISTVCSWHNTTARRPLNPALRPAEAAPPDQRHDGVDLGQHGGREGLVCRTRFPAVLVCCLPDPVHVVQQVEVHHIVHPAAQHSRATHHSAQSLTGALQSHVAFC